MRISTKELNGGFELSNAKYWLFPRFGKKLLPDAA